MSDSKCDICLESKIEYTIIDCCNKIMCSDCIIRNNEINESCPFCKNTTDDYVFPPTTEQREWCDVQAKTKGSTKDKRCPRCSMISESMVLLNNCGHTFCLSCIEWRLKRSKKVCPTCYKDFDSYALINSDDKTYDADKRKSCSTKGEHCLHCHMSESMVLLNNCGHTFCLPCIENRLEWSKLCPTCFESFDLIVRINSDDETYDADKRKTWNLSDISNKNTENMTESFLLTEQTMDFIKSDVRNLTTQSSSWPALKNSVEYGIEAIDHEPDDSCNTGNNVTDANNSTVEANKSKTYIRNRSDSKPTQRDGKNQRKKNEKKMKEQQNQNAAGYSIRENSVQEKKQKYEKLSRQILDEPANSAKKAKENFNAVIEEVALVSKVSRQYQEYRKFTTNLSEFENNDNKKKVVQEVLNQLRDLYDSQTITALEAIEISDGLIADEIKKRIVTSLTFKRNYKNVSTELSIEKIALLNTKFHESSTTRNPPCCMACFWRQTNNANNINEPRNERIDTSKPSTSHPVSLIDEPIKNSYSAKSVASIIKSGNVYKFNEFLNKGFNGNLRPPKEVFSEYSIAVISTQLAKMCNNHA